MDLSIVLTYMVFARAIFKIFRIPVNQWILATTTLDRVFVVAGLILLMNHNHPYTFTAQKAAISTPVTPQVAGIVSEVTDKNNQLIKKDDVLLKLGPIRYQARVDGLQADLVAATHNIDNLKAQLSETVTNATRAPVERDCLCKGYQRYLKSSQAKINPLFESDTDNARQNYLAQGTLTKGSVAEQTQIQSQLDSTVNGEQPQVTSLHVQLAEAKCNLEQTVIRAPSNGYATRTLIHPGTYVATLPLRPVIVFIPEQERQIVTQFRQSSLLCLKPGDEAEVVFNALPGQILTNKLTGILPVIPGGSYQAQGALQSLVVVPGTNGVLATIELDPSTDMGALPNGIYAQIAVYSNRFAHVSVMRKVLLRMTSWICCLYLDH